MGETDPNATETTATTSGTTDDVTLKDLAPEKKEANGDAVDPPQDTVVEEKEGETKKEVETEPKSTEPAADDSKPEEKENGSKGEAKEENEEKVDEKPVATTEEGDPKKEDTTTEDKEAEKDTEMKEEGEPKKEAEKDTEMKTDETKAEEKPAATVETPTPKKRGRGRPPKNPNSGTKTPTSAKSKRKSKTPPSAPLSSLSSTKRQRKSASAFEPSNFKAERLAAQSQKVYHPGRGVPLSSFESIKTNLTKMKNDPIVSVLYKLVYSTMGLTGKGKTSPTKMKNALLEFSGFFSAVKDDSMEVDGVDKEAEETRQERDQKMKEKFETKAGECTDVLLKSLCDILGIPRNKTNKPEKVHRLVEFLGEPSEFMLKASTAETVEEVIAKSVEIRKKSKAKKKTESLKKKPRGRPKKNKSKDAEEDVFEETEDVVDDLENEETEVPEDNDEDEIIDGKTVPSAKKLRAWVKAYVACFDLDKCNAKHAIGTASDKFRVDLGLRKNMIMEMLKDEIS